MDLPTPADPLLFVAAPPARSAACRTRTRFSSDRPKRSVFRAVCSRTAPLPTASTVRRQPWFGSQTRNTVPNSGPYPRGKPSGTGPRVTFRPTLPDPRSSRDGLLTSASPALSARKSRSGLAGVTRRQSRRFSSEPTCGINTAARSREAAGVSVDVASDLHPLGLDLL